MGLLVRVIVAPTPDAVAVRFPLTKLIELTLVPTTSSCSRIVIPVIAPAAAAATQVGVAPGPFDARTYPGVPFVKNTVVSDAD